jgi:biliverdin reductase / flavin reductase
VQVTWQALSTGRADCAAAIPIRKADCRGSTVKILIVGASGRLGRCLVDQALAANFMVTALARSPTSLQKAHQRLSLVRGDLLEAASLESILPGHDAILVCVAPKVKFRVESDLLSKGALNLCLAMSKVKGARLLWVTSAGVDPQYVKGKPFLYRGIIKPFFLENIYADFKLSEEILEKSSLTWSVVRPSRLTDGPLTKTYRVDANGVPENANKISRADVAHFMLEEIVDPQYNFKKALIAY